MKTVFEQQEGHVLKTPTIKTSDDDDHYLHICEKVLAKNNVRKKKPPSLNETKE